MILHRKRHQSNEHAVSQKQHCTDAKYLWGRSKKRTHKAYAFVFLLSSQIC